MLTTNEISFCRYEIKKSIFLPHIAPMNKFDELRVKLKTEHPKAAHIIWAYRYINELNQIVENANDDGEPKGSSGQPVLNVLRGLDIVNAAVLIARYFGGVKLGIGGLVRAYSASVKMVLQETNLQKYEQKEEFIFLAQYQFTQRIEYFLNKLGVDFGNRDFAVDNVVWKVEITKEQKEKLTLLLGSLK
jgi:uncharacterized YigZ family protein